jgi:hypothetical protein
MTSQHVDSDLRTLFAFGKLDDFEKLKKENGECVIVLKGIEARIQDRLKVFRNMSPREVITIHQSTKKMLSRFYLWWKFAVSERLSVWVMVTASTFRVLLS